MNDQERLKLPSELPEDFQRTSPEGLSTFEADQRAKGGRGNRTTHDRGKTVARILAENVFTFFNLLNIFLGLCLIMVGSYRNMLFLGVVLCNTVIGTVQELRARSTVRRLELLHAVLCRALRDGQEIHLPPEELVEGDIVILHSGDQIPADAIVISGIGAADESLLTGESDAVPKQENDWLLSGSYIMEGRLEAQLVRVGDESYLNQLTQAAKHIKRPKSALMTDLNRLVHLITLVLVPVGMLLMTKQYFVLKLPVNQAVPRVVAALVGMIPEGLILLCSTALAVGVVRLGKRQMLTSEMYGIEALARVDILCLDKTGTLTTGRMSVAGIIPVDADEQEIGEALSRYAGAFDDETPTMRAVRAAYPPKRIEEAVLLPFSSKRKKSAASFEDGMTLILGAPGFVLQATDQYQEMIQEQAAKGLRVLVLCEGAGPIVGAECPEAGRVLGFICLRDEIRDNARETLEYFASQKVEIKVISGDDPQTVARIAAQAGVPGADKTVDVQELATDEEIKNAALKYTVFGRVTPRQKRLLVQALKDAGHSVGMTGDGVNDIPALKAADCSIAIGSEASAARHVAQLTLLNGDFAVLPEAVAEGRRVIGNIRRTSSLFLVKTIYSVLLSLLTLILPIRYPFQPIQLTLISSLTIGIPGFFLALQPNKERVGGSFLRSVLTMAAPGAIAVALTATAASALQYTGLIHEDCSTIAVLLAGIIGLVELYIVSRPLDLLRGCVLAGVSLIFAAAVVWFSRVFFLTVRTMPGNCWIWLGALLAAGLVIMGLLYGKAKKMAAPE